jgi:acetoacetate decarboxylase
LKLDPKKIYQMPLVGGPIASKDVKLVYSEVESIALQYKTDKDAIQLLLPDCYQPSDEAVITVEFSHNSGLGFMAGGGYRVGYVTVGARFDGEKDHLEGDYVLVMGENETVPIIGGREILGLPKVYTDISPVKTLPDGHLRCEASMWGHLLFGIDLSPLKSQNVLVRRVASKRLNSRPWFGYKYISSLDEPDDASYPTVVRQDIKLKELQLGNSGEIFFGNAKERDIGSAKRWVDALQTLKILEVTQTLRMKGSAILRYDLSRRLR